MKAVSRSLAARPLAKRLRGLSGSDGAGVQLARVIGTAQLEMLDPFLLLDEFGSDDPDAYIGGFPDHPHRGFETITLMLAGQMRHRDNRGNEGLLGPGGAQWMTAGSGLVHSEMPEQAEGRMRGFQLWLNLPARLKMTLPRYRDIQAADIPQARLTGGASVHVIAGELDGTPGAVLLDPQARPTEPYLFDIRLPAEAPVVIPLPQGHSAFAYIYDGSLFLSPGEEVVRSELAVLAEGDAFEARAGEAGACVLLAAARPLGEAVARHGPFVMNSKEELRQAFDDFRAGRI